MATGKKKRRIAEIERQKDALRKAIEKRATPAPVEPETVTTTKRSRATRTPRTRKKG
tara:strand:- start:1274 stop:1444 length:171 start_codon:yes stop_codon:yes gene_type:complete